MLISSHVELSTFLTAYQNRLIETAYIMYQPNHLSVQMWRLLIQTLAIYCRTVYIMKHTTEIPAKRPQSQTSS